MRNAEIPVAWICPAIEAGRMLRDIRADRIPKAEWAKGPFVKVRQETGGISVRSSLTGRAIN